jgi:hypothetical protein
LQQHVQFFDRNLDGIITPIETFQGFSSLGFNFIFCILAVGIVHFGFSWWTSDSWIPDPLLRIQVKNIHRAKHGSDTGVMDPEGRYCPVKFEELFSKYSKTYPDCLTISEIGDMLRGLRCVGDPFGWMAAMFEWGTLFLLVRQRHPSSGTWILRREHMRAQYDGSLFYLIEQERQELQHKQKPPSSQRKTQ